MDRKWTHVMFAIFGILAAWILSKAVDWVWGYFAKPPSFTVGVIALVIAGVATYITWRNERVFELANEVTAELRKVSWPSREETINSTVIVIVTTLVSAGILGLFDGVFSILTRKIYG